MERDRLNSSKTELVPLMRRRWSCIAVVAILWWIAFVLLGVKLPAYERLLNMILVETLGQGTGYSIMPDFIVRTSYGVWFGFLTSSSFLAYLCWVRIPGLRRRWARVCSFLLGQVLAILHLRAVLIMHQSTQLEVLGTCAVLIGMTILLTASQVPSLESRHNQPRPCKL